MRVARFQIRVFTQQCVSLLLLFILVPLANLGPSLHQLGCLGLHATPTSSCSHACCQLQHFEPSDHLPEVKFHSDCGFCKFFQCFHWEVHPCDWKNECEPVQAHSSLVKVANFGITVRQKARSPPSLDGCQEPQFGFIRKFPMVIRSI